MSTSYSRVLVSSLINKPEEQLAFLKDSFEKNWDNPDAIQTAVNIVAKAQGLSTELQSSDFYEIAQFMTKLGFKVALTREVSHENHG